jgi:mRNA-degrading endonuclease RelE of RelBE toxin-antitoxin system
MAAYRTLRADDPEGARHILRAVTQLEDDPCPPGSTALGTTSFRRLYLDSYRVLYEVNAETVSVMHVGTVLPV